MNRKRAGTLDDDAAFGREAGGRKLPPRRSQQMAEIDPATLPAFSPVVATDNELFVPPFVGSEIIKGVALDDIAGYLNETALFRNQWQYRPQDGEDDEAFKDTRALDPPRATGASQGRRHPDPAGGLRLLRGVERGQRPGHLGRRRPPGRVAALHVAAPEGRPVSVHRRLRAPDRTAATRTTSPSIS